MSDDLLLDRTGDLAVYYSPFDYIERNARLVVVGITPGFTQSENAIVAARHALAGGASTEEALASAKLTASFSGTAMRNNLVAMLDAIGTAKLFKSASTAEFFEPNSNAIHFTSALRYPVFLKGKNYNGTPDMLRTPMLRHMIETYLAEEARFLPNALWLPLGPKADSAVSHLVTLGVLNSSRVLSGMPHPSGANAERIAVFLGKKAAFQASSQTNAPKLLEAFSCLKQKIDALKGDFS